jgi:murein DD-endopeptidase MepM/ murein hydrolase activator NlpD
LERRIRRLVCVLLTAVIAACGTGPVEPGFYRVEQGDTVSKIARANRTTVQNITRWNGLSNADSIEVGQVLRVAPPGSTATASASAGTAPAAARAPAAESGAAAAKPGPAVSLVWPAPGTVIRTFDGKNSKGIDIVNAAGTRIVAAADGTVVYAGNGLRGYGNLLIVKHDADYLTAYAHNRALLVKEGESVRQGQDIAEMGDTDTNRVMLHFELRYNGRSTDPARYLPPR